MSEQFRLFIALPIPDEIKNRIEAVQSEFRPLFPGNAARWTQRKQFHLTLRFLGGVEIDQVDELIKAVGAACRPFSALRLSATSLGVFPRSGPPSVLWVGVKDSDEQLTALWSALQSATGPFTREPAETHFTGHVTLARFNRLQKAQINVLAAAIAKYDLHVFGFWSADHLMLVRSELLAEGARHTVLAELELMNHG